MALSDNLREMERGREAYWLRYPDTSPTKLHWRAVAVRHCLHVLPGETILELGSGSGCWTEHLTTVLKGRNPITAAVFDEKLTELLARKQLNNVTVVRVTGELQETFTPQRFDYIVGTAILCHDRYEENLQVLRSLLKPGGQILFFEANHWNPQVFFKNTIPFVRRWARHAKCQVPMRKFDLMKVASHQGYTHIEVIPFDIVHPRVPKALIRRLQALSYIAEHAPLIKELCGTLYIWAKNPGGASVRPTVNLAEHGHLRIPRLWLYRATTRK